MKNRFAAPVASAATAIMLLGACSDDGPTTLAKGEDVDFVGDSSLGEQTMDITAVEEDGEVTGEARFTPDGLTLSLQCADTGTDGLVILGGEVSTDASSNAAQGDWVAVIIREGDPDSVDLWFEGPDAPAGSCSELLESIPEDDLTFFDVEAGDDIETG